jgi:hypothetical protein
MTAKGQGEDKPTFTQGAQFSFSFGERVGLFWIFVVPTEFPKLFPKFPNLIPDMFPIAPQLPSVLLL